MKYKLLYLPNADYIKEVSLAGTAIKDKIFDSRDTSVSYVYAVYTNKDLLYTHTPWCKCQNINSIILPEHLEVVEVEDAV